MADAKPARLDYTDPYTPGHRSRVYHIPLPVSIEEYERALHYMTGRCAKKEMTSGDSEVELVCEEGFSEPATGTDGVYSQKIYRISSRFPAIVSKLLPASCKVVHEHCWSAFPVIRTELSIPFFKKCSVIIESRHVPGLDVPPDVFADGLACPSDPGDPVIVNVAADPTPERDQCDEEEPSLVTSQSTPRLPLARDWLDKASADPDTPYITVVKRIMITFNYKGVQKKGELAGLDAYGPVFLTTHKQLVSWIDSWFPMDLEECRKYEANVLRELAQAAGPAPAAN